MTRHASNSAPTSGSPVSHPERCPFGDDCVLVGRAVLGEALGRSKSTIDTWISEGHFDRLPPAYVVGNRLSWRRCEIGAFIDGRAL